MSYLKKFLNTHSNWEELLTTFPYNLKVERDGKYILLKYSLFNSDFSLPEVKEARGVIFTKENGEYFEVAKPFYKFFNYGEAEAAKIDWSSSRLRINEKIDGSLMKVWYHEGWHLSTNSTINAFKAQIGSGGCTFGSVFMDALAARGIINFFSVWCENLDKRKTHMFELVSLETKVVIPYNLGLYYLDSRFTENGMYERDPFLERNFLMPKEYNFTDIESVITAAEGLDWKHEGFVVFDGVNRLKIKSLEYLIAFHMGNNGMVSNRTLIHLIGIGEDKELVSYFPEYKEKVNLLKEKMKMIEIYATAAKTNASEYFKRPRAEYAKWVQRMEPKQFWDFLFMCYNQNDLTFKEYSKKFTPKKWEEIL